MSIIALSGVADQHGSILFSHFFSLSRYVYCTGVAGCATRIACKENLLLADGLLRKRQSTRRNARAQTVTGQRQLRSVGLQVTQCIRRDPHPLAFDAFDL